MKKFDFSNRDATIEKLQELGVLDRLKAMLRILKVAADRNEFTPTLGTRLKAPFTTTLFAPLCRV